MIEIEYSTDKSIIFAIREAAALYLFERNREKDIPKIVDIFLSVDDYQGDRVPASEVIKEVHALSNILQDTYLGLDLNMLVNIKSLPFYKAINECIKPFLSINNELPFLLIMRLVLRFFFLVTQSIDLKLTEEKGGLRVEFVSTAPESMNNNQIDGAMVLIYRILEAFCPSGLKKVYIAHRHTSHELEYYEYIFSVPVNSAEKTSLVYDLRFKEHYEHAASSLVKSEDEVGRRFFINPLSNMMSMQFSDFSYTQRCEIIIDTMMGIIPPTRSQVAHAMNISVSTLQRRLDDEGSLFQEILQNTRRRMAKQYLAEKNLSATDVAYLLGYKSHSQFFKAFKTWFGTTPKAYQSNL